jgi:hypothetical protein
MTVSRRSFVGASLAFAAVTQLESVAGTVVKATQSFPLSSQGELVTLETMTMATFTPFLNTVFHVDTGGPTLLPLKLLAVTDLHQPGQPNDPQKPGFFLRFRVQSGKITQGTYTFKHISLGKFPLFIVASDAAKTLQTCIAIVNRMYP